MSERRRIAAAVTVIVGFGIFLIWRMLESWGPPEDGMPTTRPQPMWMVWLGVLGIAFGVVLLITTGRKQHNPEDTIAHPPDDRDGPPARC
jgi:hypothetical protein